MNFRVINESFQCENCGHPVPEHQNSCRNHCNQCLHSKHVDQNFPGDRASSCHGLMRPTHLTQSGKKGWIVLQECLKCGHTMRNKLADDDNMELAAELSRRPLSDTD